MNGNKQLRGPDRPSVPPPEEEDPRVSGAWVFLQPGGSINHTACVWSFVIVSLINSFFSCLISLLGNSSQGDRNIQRVWGANFPFMERHI
jgi:hypothetical protein